MMGFYDISENVDKYIEMCADYDGSMIYGELQKWLDEGLSLLELGSGPGFDIPFLKDHYRVTGSDMSEEFLSRLRKKYPEIPFLQVNAADIEVKGKFDCIYSNKVLHHLTRDELPASLKRQKATLNPRGIIAHSFWIGEEDETMEGLMFTNYRKDEVINIVSSEFEVLSALSYQEFESMDSLFLVARVK